MNYEFHPEARIEFIDAVTYYEACEDGLGLRFARELYSTIDRVILRPDAWPQISLSTRRCLTRRFPYGVIYEIRSEDILIIAVTHLSREPFYWSDRTL
jgi:plasmid stabilization system protein ParE